MKILIINASHRKKGNTSLVNEIIAEKLKTFGDIEIEQIFLSDLNIWLCKGCACCITIGEDHCPNKNDDRTLLEQKLLVSDGVIFASPIYAMNMTTLMKNFMDRFAFTMHRPRFFNQYTMIVSVTGAFGLDETIKSISQLKYSGFNIVQTLGLIVQNPLENVAIDDTKQIKKIEKTAEKFYYTIKNKKKIEPSIIKYLSFQLQRKFFSKLDPEKYADWKYFNEKGWFNPDCKYYTPNLKTSKLQYKISKLISKFI